MRRAFDLTDRSKAQERDVVLLRMLKTRPKPHNADADIDGLAAAMASGSTDVKKLAKLAGQTDRNKNSGKKRRK